MTMDASVTHEAGFTAQVANRVIFTVDGEFLKMELRSNLR